MPRTERPSESTTSAAIPGSGPANAHGFKGGFVLQPVGPTFVYVADDPDKAWAEIGKHYLHEETK